MAQVTVMISGRSYRMACDDGQEEHLIGLARRVDEAISRLREMFGEIGDMRLVVMAAIMIADELSEVEKKLRGLEAEISGVRDSRNAVIERIEDHEEVFAKTIDQVAARIEAMAARLSSDTPAS